MAMVVDSFFSRYLDKLADFVEEEICTVFGVEEEIDKLRRRLARISPHLQAAEQMRHQDAAINVWVAELKDVMYDVEDIIDDCMLEDGRLLKPQLPSSSSSSSKVVSLSLRLLPSRFASSKVVSLSPGLLPSWFACTKYRRQIANRIEQVNLRLEEISEDRQLILGSPKQSTPSKCIQEHHSIIYRGTTPLQVKGDIVGTQIEEAAEYLISNQILKNDEENKSCNVTGIVGMGGIGKTTLAQKIMHNARIMENFSIIAWLHVSKHYSRNGLLSNIVGFGGGSYNESELIQELEAKVVSVLNKNFFIVLDDVWSTDVWNILRNPILSSVAKRRMILVTSRYEGVLSNMEASYIYRVRGMNNDDGWQLLRNIVFKDGDSKPSKLDDIGKELVKLCCGHPLAIKVTAGVLASKDKTQKEWQKVLESDFWQMNYMDAKLSNALYLSYDDLSYPLKECFLRCALYNGIYDSRDLIDVWVAEGLIVEKDGSMLMEDVAEGYYKQLVKRNLLQLDPTFDGRYTMHDALRSLGENLIRDEGIIMTDDQPININPLTKIRRLTLLNTRPSLALPKTIMKQKCLRSLFLHFRSIRTTKIEVGLFEGLRNLRILSLGSMWIDSLPDSLYQLVHLRYLNLARTSIHEIREAIGHLVNLQTLILTDCLYLDTLPNSITKLHNLRCLRLSGSPLSHLPKEIGTLSNLNCIEGLVIGHDKDVSEGCDLKVLQSFPKMRSLKIERLGRASSTGTAVLAGKTTFLRDMWLDWGACFTKEQMERAEKKCAELMPPSTIEDLDLDNGGEGFTEEQIEKAEKIWDDLMMPPSTIEDLGLDNGGAGFTEEQIEKAEKICAELMPRSTIEDLGLDNDGAGFTKEQIEKAKKIWDELMAPEDMGLDNGGAGFTEEQMEKAEKICAELMPPSTIEDLGLDNGGARFTEEQMEKAEKICAELMPPSTIEDLIIWSFPGRQFPDLITSTSASTSLRCLTRLRLFYCSSCTELPPLGRLPQLKHLEIIGASAIKTIGPEFLGCSSAAPPAAFPKLEFLEFCDMPNWEEWRLCEGEEGGDVKLLFPTLRECNLSRCPKPRVVPENLNLKEIGWL